MTTLQIALGGQVTRKIQGTCFVDQTPTPTEAPPPQAGGNGPTLAPVGNSGVNGTTTTKPTSETLPPKTGAGATNQSNTTTKTPSTSQTISTANTTASTATKQPTTTLTPKPTTVQRRKRRDASSTTQTMAQMTDKQECVENSSCIKTAGSSNMTCQCKDGFANDNGFCQAQSSASSLRLGFFTAVMATLFVCVSL
ncbi:hypothetical protein MAR_012630 [Mya arenaria]|uniref:EGF-like domain-containing protein n=1 Tax=Mya arenaria TaxID=6604 RepID=A0ABY7G1H6_MYAAR|nr:hypothetical protein MAR_012630 [Mya arenaria]